MLSACKDKQQMSIPNVYVNVRIDIDLSEYWALKNPQGHVILKNEGYNHNGIIVFCTGENEYKAYDCTCPYQVPKNCKVQIADNSIIQVSCPCCKSRFDLYYGNKTSGVAEYPLKEYNVTASNSILIISN